MRSLWPAVALLFSIQGAVAMGPKRPSPEVVLVLDVDNCLYDDKLISSSSDNYAGVEEQIVKNIHAFSAKYVDLPKEEADALHHTYGTTIEGLRHTIWKKLGDQQMEEKMRHCYQEIWSNMDYTGLLLQHQPAMQSFTTGYSHPSSQIAQLRALLEGTKCPLYLASNSPSWHVKKTLQAMGLLSVPWAGLATPDSHRESFSTKSRQSLYPTKHSPAIFYADILESHKHTKSNSVDIILIDDSKTNIQALPQKLMKGIRVERPDMPIQTAILKALGVVDPGHYVFSQTEYLKSKNLVDAMSIHRPTWTKVADGLRAMLSTKKVEALEIVDAGAGLLSMLHLILEGDGNLQIPSLVDQVLGDDDNNADNTEFFETIEYFAYEPNRELQSQCLRTLADMGFTRHEPNETDDHECTYVSTKRGRKVTVHLRLYDYNTDPPTGHTQPNPQLIVGCCFADLLDPYHLVPSLLHRFLSKLGSHGYCLCYFPITFQGITQFIPPQPFEIKAKNSIPSDTVAFSLYSKVLEDIHQHSLDPRKLIRAMKAFGATEVASGAANWDVDPKDHPYLWQTLLFFFERVAGPALIERGWDAAGWLQRARRAEKPPSILVSNVDLLFRMPRLGQAAIVSEISMDDAIDQQDRGMEEIQFTEPYHVTTIRKSGVKLKPNQVQSKLGRTTRFSNDSRLISRFRNPGFQSSLSILSSARALS
jgi:hypothetical protein